MAWEGVKRRKENSCPLEEKIRDFKSVNFLLEEFSVIGIKQKLPLIILLNSYIKKIELVYFKERAKNRI